MAPLPHLLPKDFKHALTQQAQMQTTWHTLTPLAKNEWICWVTSAKKRETRIRRITIACEQLKNGKRRPCCWAGCIHR